MISEKYIRRSYKRDVTFLFKVYIFINIFKEYSNTPSHGFYERFFCEAGVSHISWRDYCDKKLLINAGNCYLTRNQERERRRTSCPKCG